MGAGSAAANPGGLTLHYSCTLPPFPAQIALTGQVTWNAPESLPVGRATSAYVFDITATVDASATQLAQFLGVEAVEGTVDGAVVVRAPEGDIPVSKSESVPEPSCTRRNRSASGCTVPPGQTIVQDNRQSRR